MSAATELTESMADYLEAIYRLQGDGQVARVKDIAARLRAKMPSVRNALAALRQRKLLSRGSNVAASAPAIPLPMLGSCQSGMLVDVRGGWGVRQHLSAMGLRPGVHVTMISNAGSDGPLTSEVMEARGGLGSGLGRRGAVRFVSGTGGNNEYRPAGFEDGPAFVRLRTHGSRSGRGAVSPRRRRVRVPA